VSSVRACFGACSVAPATPTLTSPAGIALSGTVQLRWQSAGDEFEVEVSGGALTQTLRLAWAGGAQRGVVLPVSDAPYAWRVRAANGFGSGPWAGGTFRVIEASQRVFLPVTMRSP
jgi:hypothetical protein